MDKKSYYVLGIAKMRLGSIKRTKDRGSQKGLDQATATIVEEERIREERARKKKNRFSWHFG